MNNQDKNNNLSKNKPIRILIGGSPCTHWSICQKQNRETTCEGLGWELFKNYLIAKERYRGTEIEMWLKNWGGDVIESFVILDDESDMKPHMKHLVQTSWQTGLCQKDVDKAVKILGEK